jgi:hypothetical protein
MLKRVSLALLLAIFFISCTNTTTPTPKQIQNSKTTIYYIHRKGCPACIYMDNILKQNDIKAIINKDFNLITVDYRDQSILPKKSMITFKTPTLYFLKGKKEIHSPIHALEAEKFKALLKSLK